MKKPTLGLSMIVKNEEEVIGRCLDCVKDLFDEIVIVDTGSTDKTKEIIAKYTDKIYDFEWIYDFAAARNYSFSKNTCDFIMWLDADDIIDEENLNKLKELKENLDLNVDAYKLRYCCSEDKNGNPLIDIYRERIVRNNHQDRWTGKIHEVMAIDQSQPKIEIQIKHKKISDSEPDRNLKIYQKMEENKDEFTIRDLTLYSRELIKHKQYDKALKVIDRVFKRKFDRTQKFHYDRSLVNKFRIYCILNKSDKEKKKLLINHLNNFMPSPVVCTELGNIFLNEKDYPLAKYWYDTGLYVARDYPDDEVEYNGYYELYQLSIVYYYLRQYDKAVECSRAALNIHPDRPEAKKNYEEFRKIYVAELMRRQKNRQ